MGHPAVGDRVVAERDFLFELRAGDPLLEAGAGESLAQTRGGRKFLEVLDELEGVEGLGEELEVIATGAGAGENLHGGGLSAEEDDADVGEEFLNFDSRFDAVEIGHEDVGEEDLGGDAAGGVDGFLATHRRLRR